MATMHPMSRIISVSDLPWEERQPGVKRKLLWEDPATQRRALMNRIEPRAQFPCHRHECQCESSAHTFGCPIAPARCSAAVSTLTI